MDAPRRWSPSNPWVFTKKTPFMQRLADRVRRGAELYISGQTPLKGIPDLCTKLDGRYPLNLMAMQASRRRKQGHGTYHWLGLLDEQTKMVTWFLLLNPGTQIDHTERWRGVNTDRPKLTGYELVRHTRKGAASPAYTWRYTRTRMDEIRSGIVSAIRGRRDVELQQWVHSIWRSPGFAGVREQVKKLRLLIIAEWQRNRGSTEGMVELPRTIGYVRRLTDKGAGWAELMGARVPEESDAQRSGNLGDEGLSTTELRALAALIKHHAPELIEEVKKLRSGRRCSTSQVESSKPAADDSWSL